MGSAKAVSYWWAIALTDSLSIPAAIVWGGFALIARNSCDTTCDAAGATTLGVVAAVLLGLSITSAAATCLRRPTLAHLSWVATLFIWAAAAVLVVAR